MKKNNMLRIDRSGVFNISELSSMHTDHGIAEQDENSTSLHEINVDDIELVPVIQGEKGQWNGGNSKETKGQKLQRLKDSGYVKLDIRILRALLENQHLIPEKWKISKSDPSNLRDGPAIYFYGTIRYDPDGVRLVAYLQWLNGEWGWNTLGPDEPHHNDDVSAVLRVRNK